MTADLERRIQTTEMKCYHRLLGISYKDHITNAEIQSKITNAVRPQEDVLITVKKRKLTWCDYKHATNSSGLAKTSQNKPARKRARKEKERKTEKAKRGQHHRKDRKVVE